MTNKFNMKPFQEKKIKRGVKVAADAKSGFRRDGGLNVKNLSVLLLQENLYQDEDDLEFEQEEARHEKGHEVKIAKLKKEIAQIKAELVTRKGAKDAKEGKGNFRLFAEHGGTNKLLAVFNSKAAAKSFVDSKERQGTWPEGSDAVLQDTKTGKKYMYTDDWDPM